MRTAGFFIMGVAFGLLAYAFYFHIAEELTDGAFLKLFWPQLLVAIPLVFVGTWLVNREGKK